MNEQLQRERDPVTRYDIVGNGAPRRASDGDWVRYEDHAAELTALRERVQADDGEPIDEDWLRSIGFEYTWVDDWWEAERVWQTDEERTVVKVWGTGDAFVSQGPDSAIVVPQRIETRGSLRLLCRALGIELTPTPGA